MMSRPSTRSRTLPFFAGIGLLLASCAPRAPGSDVAPAGGGPLRTDRVLYVLETKDGYVYEDHVAVQFVNRAASPLYFEVCGQKDESVSAGASGTRPVSEIVRPDPDTASYLRHDFRFAWACLQADRLAIPPGAVLLDTVWLVTTRDEGRPCARPAPRACSPPRSRAATTGWFQIEYRIYLGPRGDPAAQLLPREARRTNRFEVRWRE